jgi:hypothetical protein
MGIQSRIGRIIGTIVENSTPLNIYQIKRETIFARLGEKSITIDKHLIANMFKISNKGWKKQK